MQTDKEQDIQAWTIAGAHIGVTLTNYGATVMSIITPDRHGHQANVVAGFAHPTEYFTEHPYFGCVVGRFTNRISGASFLLDGENIRLSLNEKVNQLHGGFEGFNRKVWKLISHSPKSISFFYRSPDGEEGYPGNLDVTVRYSIKAENALLIEYEAATDKPTIVSLTNHSYFNLSGFGTPVIHGHLLLVNAAGYTVKNENNTSTGEIREVKDSPLDFRQAHAIGERIAELETDMGYDHNYVLESAESPAARLTDPLTGRSMEVFTNQPGMQVYTSNWWDGSITGQQGIPYIKHGAVALETQALPDAPNQTGFPTAVLRPGETYRRYTIYEFSAG